MLWECAWTISKRMELDTIQVSVVERVHFNDWHERMALIEAIETWLENWNKEFAYHDRHGLHMPRRNYVDSTLRLR